MLYCSCGLRPCCSAGFGGGRLPRDGFSTVHTCFHELWVSIYDSCQRLVYGPGSAPLQSSMPVLLHSQQPLLSVSFAWCTDYLYSLCTFCMCARSSDTPVPRAVTSCTFFSESFGWIAGLGLKGIDLLESMRDRYSRQCFAPWLSFHSSSLHPCAVSQVLPVPP